MKKQSIIIKAATILLLVIITTFKAKADNYEIIIEPYLENKPTSVGELQYRCILLMTKDKIPQKKISKIEQLYREICNKEPEWSAYASCLYGTFLINSLSPLADKSKGASLLLDAIEMTNDLPDNVKAYYSWVMGKAYLKGLGIKKMSEKHLICLKKHTSLSQTVTIQIWPYATC